MTERWCIVREKTKHCTGSCRHRIALLVVSKTKIRTVLHLAVTKKLGCYLTQPFLSDLRDTPDIRLFRYQQFGVDDTFGCRISSKQGGGWMDRDLTVSHFGTVPTPTTTITRGEATRGSSVVRVIGCGTYTSRCRLQKQSRTGTFEKLFHPFRPT